MEQSNLFYDNKYTKWYSNIIDRAWCRTKEKDVYYEEHHVIPRSIFKEKSWTVFLTAKEHYLVHVLLTKMAIDAKHRRSMAYALWPMKAKNQWHGQRFTGAMYQLLKERFSIFNKGELNPFYGKIHTAETIAVLKKKCREASLGEKNGFYGKGYLTTGEKNHFYGKQHTDETKAKISAFRKGNSFASGPYRLVSPEGIEHIVKKGIYLFCKEHGLVGPNVIQAAQKGHKSRGWTVELYETNRN